MTHQVNLNQKSILPGYGPVQLPTFLVTTLVAMLLSGVWFSLAWIEHQSLLTEEQEQRQLQAAAQQRLDDFQRQYPKVSNEPELLAQNQALTERLQRSRETYSGLAVQLENSADGFLTPLQQLSDYDLNGLWLSQIRLQDGQRRFLLEGFARDPELIPQYIEQLGQSSFDGISIEYFRLTKQENNALWQFSLSNTPLNDIAENR